MDKYIGESARLIREMFGYAKEHQVVRYEENSQLKILSILASIIPVTRFPKINSRVSSSWTKSMLSGGPAFLKELQQTGNGSVASVASLFRVTVI